MIKIENAHVYGIMDAIRGMRNPLNSWSKLDSSCKCDPLDGHILELNIGPNDTKLCNALTVGGQPHRKFLRQINVTMDITAPAYWWAEMDTYKICTTRNSCSLQHKGASRDFEIGDLSIDGLDYQDSKLTEAERIEQIEDAKVVLNIANKWRRKYVDGGKTNYDYFRAMRQLIPMGYNYRATWSGTYETLLNIFEWRQHHLLREWHGFCDEIKKLPGMHLFLAKYIDSNQRN